jgi:glycosyltransferase involved in cell wall biosynthesis
MNKEDLVSIISPVYNSERFLQACIESVKGQTFQQWEHILVDDCSTDNSSSIIQKYARQDKRFRYYRLNQNSGPGVARNKAIELATGRFIAFLDSDDTWYPDKLERQIRFMEESGNPFTYTSYDCINVKGELLDRKVMAPKKVTYKSALYKNPIGCLTVIYDTGFFGKQFMPTVRKRQDYALWLKLLKKADAYGLQEVLASYRIGNKSISSNKLSLIKYEWLIYRQEEGLGVFKSVFYVLTAIFFKLKSYF